MLKQHEIDKFYNDDYLDCDLLDIDVGLQPNEYAVMKATHKSQSAIGRYFHDTNQIKPIVNYRKVWNIQSKNKEQSFALDLLMDKNVQLASLIGPAGTGKTLIALAAGIEQIVEQKIYKKLIVIKPIQSVGNDIGYLPGTLQEKLEPWTAPIKDNLNVLFVSDSTYNKPTNKNFKNQKNKIDNTYLEILMEQGIIEIEAVSFIRGRSIPNAYIVIDESQNLSMHELKTIITRAGEGTKIVLTGDVEQIDNQDVDSYTNGLSYAVDKFKSYDIAGHVTLIKGVRSKLATLAAKIL
jgi:PhoH-like ATPase